MIQKSFNCIDTAGSSGEHQRRRAIGVCGIHFGVRVEQELDYRGIAVIRRQREGVT